MQRKFVSVSSKKNLNHFIVNNLLLIFGLAVIISGLLLQVEFHMGSHERHRSGIQLSDSRMIQYEQLREINTGKIVWGLNYSEWSFSHKFVIVGFSLLMIYHTFVHWKWYKGLVNKHLYNKNKEVTSLSVLFLITAVTGLLPWFIDMAGGTSNLRMSFIEIHDKITFILIAFLLLHFIKRAKWYIKTYEKFKRM